MAPDPELAAAIAAASRALDAGQIEGAIEALAAAWCAVHDARIAGAIATLAGELPPPAPIQDTGLVRAREHAWHFTIEHFEPGDLPRLLATPWPGTRAAIEARFVALAKLPADPRTVEALEHARRWLDWSMAGGRALVNRIRAYTGGFIPVTSDDPALAALLARIAARSAPTAGDAPLLAAVRSDPEDRGARSVLADSLATRGDPRGEMMALQLALDAARAPDRVRDLAAEHAAETRVRQLIGKHRRAWVDTLDRHFAMDARWYRDGFFAGGNTFDRKFVPSDPAWQHVRVLGGYDAKAMADVARMLVQPACANVDTLLVPDTRFLANHAWPRIVHVRASALDVDIAALWSAVPALRELAIPASALPALLAARAPSRSRRLARLALIGWRAELAPDGFAPLASWTDAIVPVPTPAQAVSVHAQFHPGWSIEIDVRHAALHALYFPEPDHATWVTELAHVLAAVPPTWLRTIHVGPVRRKPTDAERAKLRAALEAHTAATTIATPWS